MALSASLFIMVLGCSYWLVADARTMRPPKVTPYAVEMADKVMDGSWKFVTFKFKDFEVSEEPELDVELARAEGAKLAEFISALLDTNGCRYGLVNIDRDYFEWEWEIFDPEKCSVNEKMYLASYSEYVLEKLNIRYGAKYLCGDKSCLTEDKILKVAKDYYGH